MNKKAVFLFLALILPGLVFVFLKKFGKNEFAIPIYYETGVDSVNTVCGVHYSEPYHVPDSMLKKSGWQPGRPALFVLDSVMNQNSELNRLGDAFDNKEYQIIQVTKGRFGVSTVARWSSCVLLVKPAYNVVLVDPEKRIRGYYAIGSREEADRLMLELEILLKKY